MIEAITVDDEIEAEDEDTDAPGGCAGRCKDCILLSRFEESQIAYAGFETVGRTAEICFVGEAPGMDELKQGRPFVGKAGSFLRETLDELGLKSYHLLNAMQCHPKTGGIRTPQPEEVKHCSKNVKQFINENRPKLVIMLGKSAYEGLMNEDFYKNKTVTAVSKQRAVEIDGVRYAACFHPSYIIRNGGKKSPQYSDFVDRLKGLIYGNVREEAPVVPFEIKNLDNLKEVLSSYMRETDLGFDYEGTSLSPYSKEFKILGFALAALNPPRATYIDFHRPITQPEKKMLGMFLERKKPWTYNANYESKVSWANIADQFIEFNDAFVICKMIGSKGRLKDNARKHVGADYWEELVTSIRELFEAVFKRIDRLNKELATLEAKVDPSARQQSQTVSLGQLKSAMLAGDQAGIEKILSEDKNVVKYIKIRDEISELQKFCSTEQIARGLTKYPNSWEAIPTEMTGEYCCYDSYYTLLLKNKLWSEKNEAAYPYYISQAWAGSAMESYGLNWNDETASRYEDFYFDEAIKCLHEVINRIDFGEERIELDQKGKQVQFKGTDELRLDALTIVGDSSTNKLEKLKLLKKIFNPQSSTTRTRNLFFDQYTTDFVKAITILYCIEEEIMSSPVIPDRAKELINPDDLNATVKSLMFCNWSEYCGASEALQKNIRRAVERMVGSLNASMEEHLGKFASDIIEWQFRAHKFYGGLFTKPDKESGEKPQFKPFEQWTEEFKLLYYLRRYKKVIKNQTTYLNKKLGRENVWLSEVSDDYSVPPKRIKRYFDVSRDYKLKSNERWILDTDFNVMGANTLRWTAGIHTVPASCELREIYEARRSDSLFLHLDYSQAEIRLLAALSGDKALLKAFEGGADIHKFVASRVFNKPEDQVSEVERKFSKNCSFSITYGKSLQAFADDFMGGDLPAATKLFDDFFKAFPDVKRWIDARHQEAEQSGKVTTFFGTSLTLDMRDFNGAMRDAQNWGVQSSASTLAAHCIYQNFKQAREKRIPVLPMVFTHDSHDMEFRTQQLFEVIDNVYSAMVDIPLNQFKIPMKIDLEIGNTQGTTVKLEVEKQPDPLKRTYRFSAEESVVDVVFDRLKEYFKVDYQIVKTETKRSSLEEMFIPKKAFSKYLGTEKKIVSGTLTLARI